MKKLDLKGFMLGNSKIEHGLVLSPMAGATDHAFRVVCKAMGAELVVSEMISAKALCYEQRCKKSNAAEKSRTAPLAAVTQEELPMSLQLFGAEPEFMAEAAELLVSGEYFGARSTAVPTAIDINMGCPVAKVAGNGEGSALMRDPRLAGEIVRAVSDRINIPVTVKIRAGWDKDSINAAEVAKILEQSGASMICVHGRTRAQFYEPYADLEIIRRVKEAVSVPIVGNGDVASAEAAIKMANITGCDGIAIGRGALGNPWIFSELIAASDGRDFTAPPISERLEIALSQAEQMVKEKGEYVAVREARKHISWYINSVRGAAAARNRINSAETIEEMRSIAAEICLNEEDNS